MGYDLNDQEVAEFLKDKKLITEVVKSVVSNKEIGSRLHRLAYKPAPTVALP